METELISIHHEVINNKKADDTNCDLLLHSNRSQCDQNVKHKPFTFVNTVLTRMSYRGRGATTHNEEIVPSKILGIHDDDSHPSVVDDSLNEIFLENEEYDCSKETEQRIHLLPNDVIQRKKEIRSTISNVACYTTKQRKLPEPTSGGHASMASSMFNLVNNVAGAGILTLSAGKAAGTGWIPAIVVCVVLGATSAYTFLLVGYACELTSESDFKGLWDRTLGSRTTYLVDLMIALLCLGITIIYSSILGDLGSSFLLHLKWTSDVEHLRTYVIIVITVLLLFPMALAKRLSTLAVTSVLGCVAVAYTVLFVAYRSLDGSYSLQSGHFVMDGSLSLLPSFDHSTLWNVDFGTLVLCSNLGTSIHLSLSLQKINLRSVLTLFCCWNKSHRHWCRFGLCSSLQLTSVLLGARTTQQGTLYQTSRRRVFNFDPIVPNSHGRWICHVW
jgi:hypothetical protein